MADGDEGVMQALAALRVDMQKGLGDLGAELAGIGERLDRIDTGQTELRVDLAMQASRQRTVDDGRQDGPTAARGAGRAAGQADGGEVEDLRRMMRILQRSHDMMLEQFTVLARRARNAEGRLAVLEGRDARGGG